jgi:muramoyltetrapeptide carboxypeptidase LdcA involved in peptidoglycan recycling
MGVLDVINGAIFGKPYDDRYHEEYRTEISRVLREYGRETMPVLLNASFGHCEPKCVLPFGAQAELNCDSKTFTILESGAV